MDASARRHSFEYRVVPGGPGENRLELHVLVRAYRDCWIALHAEAPTGRHRFDRLGIAIEFDGGGG